MTQLGNTITAALTAPEDRPAAPSALSVSLTFGWRSLLRIRHVPEQLFDVTAFPIMTTLLFTYLFGGAIAGSVDEYVQFLIPGILVQTVVMITHYTAMNINGDITKGVFDRFRSLPIWRPAVLVGSLLGDALRYSLASALVLAMGLLMGFRAPGGIGGVLLGVAIMLAFCFCLSWLWLMLAMILRTPNSVMGVAMFLLFPLTFISNVFVDPATMPGWLQAFVEVNPISHVVTAVRSSFAGEPDAGALLVTGCFAAGILLVFGPLTMRLYNRK